MPKINKKIVVDENTLREELFDQVFNRTKDIDESASPDDQADSLEKSYFESGGNTLLIILSLVDASIELTMKTRLFIASVLVRLGMPSIPTDELFQDDFFVKPAKPAGKIKKNYFRDVFIHLFINELLKEKGRSHISNYDRDEAVSIVAELFNLEEENVSKVYDRMKPKKPK